MNAGHGPFGGWEKWRKNRLTNKLLKIVSNGQMTAAGCGMDLRAFDELFPRRQPRDYAIAYIICMGTLLHAIAEAAKKHASGIQIAIVHDHSQWDVHALDGYNRWINDNSWGERHRFVGITSLTWRDDVGLQAADLIAYEGMRLLDSELWSEDVPMRYALRHLLSSKVAIYGVYHSRKGLEALARFYEEQYGYKVGTSEAPGSSER